MRGAVVLMLAVLATGCKGPAGAPGAPGKDGAPGTAGVELVTKKHTIAPGSDAPGGHRTETIQVPCPAGKKVLAGGFNGQTRGLNLRSSLPVSDEAWEFVFESTIGLPMDVSVVVTCAIAR
jgi:hypothetical protein